MTGNHNSRFVLVAVIMLVLRAMPAWAHGDKVFPQVVDGPNYSTKFDFINLGPDPSTTITKVTVLFYLSNGSSWNVATNLGTSSAFTLNMGAYQTLRLETLGQSASDTSGYVIVRNLEGNSVYPDDFEVAITCYYEVRSAGKVVDTVSIPAGQSTVSFKFPAQIDDGHQLYTGFAIVNLSNAQNRIDLRMYQAKSPSSTSLDLATDYVGNSILLKPSEHQAVFLFPTLFPAQSAFKGMVDGEAAGPVAILALLQSPTPSGIQFATMVPAYVDSLRRNTQMYLQQGLPLDADIPVSDYFGNEQDSLPWDLLYVTEINSSTQRHLQAQNGATFEVLGSMPCTDVGCPFDDVTLDGLRKLPFAATSVDMSDNSTGLNADFAFAIKTGLGRYVKVRILYVVTTTSTKDLVLEIYVYK